MSKFWRSWLYQLTWVVSGFPYPYVLLMLPIDFFCDCKQTGHTQECLQGSSRQNSSKFEFPEKIIFVTALILWACFIRGLEIICKDDEWAIFNPPAGDTCEGWAGPYIAAVGGYLRDPNATTDCGFCPFKVNS